MSQDLYYEVPVLDPATGKSGSLRFPKPRNECHFSPSPWGQARRLREKIDFLEEERLTKDARIVSLSRENRRLRVIIAVLLIFLFHLLLR